MEVEIRRGGMRPGSIGNGTPLSSYGMPRKGYIHLDSDEFVEKPRLGKEKSHRLDAAWNQWGRTMQANALAAVMHLDVGETIFFMRELAEIKAQAFDIKYAQLKGRTLVPIVSGDPGAETFIYTQFDYAGKAKRIIGGAGDSPRVNVKGVQYINPYNSYGASFDYSIPELRAAAKAGRSIDALRAKACRDAIAQTQDDILAIGDPDADNGSGSSSPMEGLLSYCLAGMGSQSFVPATVSGSTVWMNNKTADQIIADVNSMISQVPADTQDVEHVKRVVLPVAQYNFINSTPRSTVSDTTVLEFLEDAWPDIEFVSWNRLAGAGVNAVSPGSGAHDMMIGYDPSPDKVWCPISIEYEQLAPQLERYVYAVYAEMRMGGVVSPYPKSLIFGSGI